MPSYKKHGYIKENIKIPQNKLFHFISHLGRDIKFYLKNVNIPKLS